MESVPPTAEVKTPAIKVLPPLTDAEIAKMSQQLRGKSGSPPTIDGWVIRSPRRLRLLLKE